PHQAGAYRQGGRDSPAMVWTGRLKSAGTRLQHQVRNVLFSTSHHVTRKLTRMPIAVPPAEPPPRRISQCQQHCSSTLLNVISLGRLPTTISFLSLATTRLS